MRYFPSAARQRLAVASVAGAVTLSLLATTSTSPIANADEHHKHSKALKHRHRQVQGRIHSASADLDEASHALTRATAAVSASRDRLHTARVHLTAVRGRLGFARDQAGRLRDELEQSKARLAAATAALEQGQQAVADARETIKANVVTTYTQGDPHLRAVGSLFGASSLADLTSGLSTEDIILDRGDQAYDDLTAAENALADQQDAVEAATRSVADKTHAATRQVLAIKDLYAEAATARHQVAALVARNVTARRHAMHVRAHDRGVLKALDRREADLKHKILAIAAREAARAAARKAAGKQGGYTGDTGGLLSYPAVGYPITSPYGYRVHPIYGYYSLHDGDDFGIPCGTPLHAAADGTVIEEYYDDVWGNRVIVNLGRVNGQNLTVIYNHMSHFDVHAGQHVQRGQVLGLSGTTGWSTGCHLHFTVMADGTAVDPMKYL